MNTSICPINYFNSLDTVVAKQSEHIIYVSDLIFAGFCVFIFIKFIRLLNCLYNYFYLDADDMLHSTTLENRTHTYFHYIDSDSEISEDEIDFICKNDLPTTNIVHKFVRNRRSTRNTSPDYSIHSDSDAESDSSYVESLSQSESQPETDSDIDIIN